MKTFLLRLAFALGLAVSAHALELIILAPDGRSFITAETKQIFHPWGLNYGNEGRLMEDFWDQDWDTFAADFREMKQLGANVVRVHLQYGKFMVSPVEPNPSAFSQLSRLLKLAEDTGLYLDITGLACYRPADAPAWYDALDEAGRWSAQASFWTETAKICHGHPAVFCYDLINEPIVPGEKREPGKWRSGHLFGGYDFVQFIALDPAGRAREDIAAAWCRRMREAIVAHDTQHLITVGLLPWSRQWKHLSGFLPAKVAPELDFLSVHVYPDSKLPGEALESLKQFAAGKPVVIEETFPLSCTPKELEEFLLASREFACGWMGHYDGAPPEELGARERAGKLTVAQAFYREWMRLFVRLKPQLAPEK
jgi:hypothetical protein